ncbi:MAG: NUDIX hydrolase [Sphaerochaetaceae bacterium]|nr:NUDIX hydrolase [Sphaerochaetaceae bacterium]MDC7243260.1 NUDIX hydrolase [Sphaerochaetaceae bacterium]
MKDCKGAAILIYKRKNDEIEVLLGKRKYFPNIGFWGIPGGKMEDKDNNNFEQTAKRECFEETGIEINNNLILLDEIRDNKFIWNTYVAQVDENTTNIFKEEVLESAWFNVKSLPSPLVDLLEDQIIRAKSIILNK